MAVVSSKSYKTLDKLSRLGIECSNCHSKEMAIEVRCQVTYLNLIPTWASNKHLVGHCDKCGEIIPFSRIPAYHQPKGLELLKKSSYKWYYFIGIFLFTTFILGSILLIFSGSSERDKQLYNDLQNINSNNVVFYKLDNGDFTSMKVIEVRNDTIFVNENKLSTNKNFYSIDQDNNYSQKTNFYTRKQLDEMLTNETIKNIY